MPAPVVIIGMGEMGGVFARGLLRSGHPVYPILRKQDPAPVAQAVPAPKMVLVAVAEVDFDTAVAEVPAYWRDRLVLLQNELLPRDWRRHELEAPTVISVWFEKKKGRDAKVLLPSPVYGAHAGLLVRALGAIDIPARALRNGDELLLELVIKNVYILTVNIAGLVSGGTVSELWAKHEKLARRVADNVMDIQEWLTGYKFDRDQLLQGMLRAFDGDPQHQCTGRSATVRLQRALAQADEAGLAVAVLREIAQ